MSRLKFTIHGFQQQKLIEHGLDNNDALVMAVVRDMYSSISVEHKIIDGDRYIWVNQTALSEYVPIIGALRTFQRIFKKLTDKGVFESRVVNGRNGKTGKYFYLKPSQLLEDLTEYVAIAQGSDQPPICHMINRQNDGRSSDNLSGDQPPICRNKDTPTNDSPTNDTKQTPNPQTGADDDSKKSPAKKSSYSEQFERWWAIYPRKTAKGAAWNRWKREKLDSKVDQLIEKLEQQNALQYAFTETQYIPNASTYLNQKRYDDEVEDRSKKSPTPKSVEQDFSKKDYGDFKYPKWMLEGGKPCN